MMTNDELLAWLDRDDKLTLYARHLAAARIRALIAEVQAEHDRTDRWQDRWQDEADRAEKAETEVARLIAERDAIIQDFKAQSEARGIAEAEVARLRAVVSAFLSYADQCPNRAAHGAGGQTMDNMARGTIVLVSLWEIEGLRAALATEDRT